MAMPAMAPELRPLEPEPGFEDEAIGGVGVAVAGGVASGVPELDPSVSDGIGSPGVSCVVADWTASSCFSNVCVEF